MISSVRARVTFALVMAAAFAIGVAAPATAASDFSARVPAAMRSAGKIVIGTAATYPPLEFKDPATNTLLGLDIDLGNEIGKRLGLKVEWQDAGFAQLINSLATGRIDMGASGMTDIPQRREKLDFVDYFLTGTQLFTVPAHASELKQAQDVCGKSVAVNRNGIFLIRVSDFNAAECVGKGRAAINFSLTDQTADARLQLIQGRVVAAAAGIEAIHYINEAADSPDRGKYALFGEPVSRDFAGFGFSKDQPELRNLIADVVTEMIADGSYAAIFAKWAMPYAQVKVVTINGAPR